MSIETFTEEVLDLLKPDNCVTIPRYQRKYAWTEVNAHQLIVDLAKTLTDPKEKNHWIGAAITRNLTGSEKCDVKKLNHRCVELIDGQQRFTTLRLWLLALEHFAKNLNIEFELELAKLRLQSPNDSEFQLIESGDLEQISRENNDLAKVYLYFRYILWLGEDALLSPDSYQIPNLKLKDKTIFEKWEIWLDRQIAKGIEVRKSGQPDVAKLVEATLNKLSVLYLRIRDEDPVRIFSALNGNRTELSQFDHLRNFVFGQLTSQIADQGERDLLFDNYWRKSEEILEGVPTGKGSNADKVKNEFLYDYLISLGEGAYGKFSYEKTYSAITKYINERLGVSNLEAWIKKLPDECRIWTIQKFDFSFAGSLSDGHAVQLPLKNRLILQRLRYLSDGPPSSTIFFILRRGLLEHSSEKKFDMSDVTRSLRNVEKVLFKTVLSGKSLTTFNGWSIRSLKHINEMSINTPEQKASDVFSVNLDKYEAQTWDQVLQKHAINFGKESKSLYEVNQRATMAILDVINEELNGGAAISLVPVKNVGTGDNPFWIEHIFPQKDAKWQADLANWKANLVGMRALLHEFGNLSLLPNDLNIKMSNWKFEDKKGEIVKARSKSGMNHIIPNMNDAWFNAPKWTQKEIQERTEKFWEILEKRWKA
jgi:uncharacterized protein with ParB-like and HNH nuclease domain